MPPTRLEGLDLARYLAFVGMVFVNFKVAMGAENGHGLLSQLSEILEGRAAATFVVLAGLGLGLASIKNKNQTISLTIKRVVFLLVLGLLNTLVFDADILHYYAFYFLFGVLFLSFGSPLLIGVVIALNILFVILILVLNYNTGWNWEEYSYTDFWTPLGFIRNLFFNGWHPIIPWLSFLLIGILLSRVSLTERLVQWKLVIGGGLLIIFAEVISAVVSPVFTSIDTEFSYLVSTHPIPPMPLYMIAGIGAAWMILGFCLLIAEWLKRKGISKFLLPAGRQTLTLYIAHIFIGMGILDELGMLGGQTIGTAMLSALIFCIVITIYAVLWSKHFTHGPIEALMRKLAG